MLAQLARVRAQPLGLGALVARLHRLEVGAERHLRVDDDLLAAGQPHDEVRTLPPNRAPPVRRLRHVVDVLGHARPPRRRARVAVSPHRPRICGARSAVTSCAVSRRSCFDVSAMVRSCSCRVASDPTRPRSRTTSCACTAFERVGRLGADRVAQHIARAGPLVRALRREQPADARRPLRARPG